MDFELTKEQLDIQKAAAEFAKGEFDPDAVMEFDENARFPEDIRKKACELGFVGMPLPEEYDGAGFGLLENALITEAFCRQESGIGMALALSDFGAEMILRYGSEDQKQRVLPVIARGEGFITMAFLEDGYSLTPMKTSAKRRGGEFILDGMKNFVPFADMAMGVQVICQVDPDVPAAQTVFLIDTEAEGVETADMGEKVGMRMIPLSRISLSEARAPAENIVGQESQGHHQLQDCLREMRIEAGAMATGIAQGGLDRALEYAKQREAFGKAIVSFDAIRNKLADMYAEVETARLVTYRAAWSFDQGKENQGVNLLSKMIPSLAARRVTSDAIQIHGGLGYMKEGHVERFYRDARVLDLFIEPEQIQRNKIADYLTGTAK